MINFFVIDIVEERLLAFVKTTAGEGGDSGMKKNPWVAAVLNIILSGLGYIYGGKRRVFGILLLAGEVMTFFALIQNPLMLSLLSSVWIFIASVLWKAALALDGYNDAKA